MKNLRFGVFFFKIILFILFLTVLSLLLHRLFPYLSRVGATLVAVCRLLVVVVSHCRAHSLGCMDFSSCGLWARWLQLPASGAQAQ